MMKKILIVLMLISTMLMVGCEEVLYDDCCLTEHAKNYCNDTGSNFKEGSIRSTSGYNPHFYCENNFYRKNSEKEDWFLFSEDELNDCKLDCNQEC